MVSLAGSLSLHMSAILGHAKQVPNAGVAKLTYDFTNHFSLHKATPVDKSENKDPNKDTP